MGKSKTELFTEQQNILASWAKAIAHPARIAILEHLITSGTCVCGDIVDDLPLSQSTVSQHLKAMKEAGIITQQSDGTFSCYCLNMETCQKFFSVVTDLLGTMRKCC